MKKTFVLIACLAFLSSCMKHDDLYNPNQADEKAKENFPVENIDPNQNWTTRGTRTLDVTVNEKTGQTYTIKVYTANPFSEKENPRLLAQAEVKDGVTTTLKFDVALALEYVYVMRKVSEKDYLVTAVALENEKFVAHFGEELTSRAAVAARSISIDEDVYTCPDDAEEITAESDFKNLKEGNYIVKDKITVEDISLKEDVHLYVSGTLEVDNEIKLSHKNSFISVLEGGKLIIDDDFSISTNSTFYNAGTVEADDVKLEGGTWLNAGTFSSESFDIKNSVSIQNSCKLIVWDDDDNDEDDGVFSLSGNSTFYNEGYVKCLNSYIGNKAALHLSGESVFQVKNIASFHEGGVLNGESGVRPYPLFAAETLKSANGKKDDLEVYGTIYVSSTGSDSDALIMAKFNKLTDVNITDNSSGCVPKVTDKDDPTENIPIDGYTVAFEDVTINTDTDYDFNDLVLFVSNAIDEQSTVFLVAAGAKNRLRVGYYDKSGNHIGLWDNKEVHTILNISEGAIFNTGGSLNAKNLPKTTLPVPAGSSVLESYNFYILVNDDQQPIYSRESNKYTGDVPFGLCVSGDWNFPREGQRIDIAYSGFGSWGANMGSNQDWYKHGEANSICSFNSKDLPW